MKKKDSAGLGMTIPKRMRIAGMTFYLRNGQVVGRESSTHEKRSNTLPQFIQRQKMRHTTALWKMLRFCNVMFTERRTAYQNFASLANQLPVVYVPDDGIMNQASFLMPGIPMSDGILPTVKQELGEEFADDMKGWALVKVVDDRCSPQTIVTRCTLYQQYTTKEALERAADSYGGLTGTEVNY